MHKNYKKFITLSVLMSLPASVGLVCDSDDYYKNTCSEYREQTEYSTLLNFSPLMNENINNSEVSIIGTANASATIYQGIVENDKIQYEK